jgi:hypothetical protein
VDSTSKFLPETMTDLWQDVKLESFSAQFRFEKRFETLFDRDSIATFCADS